MKTETEKLKEQRDKQYVLERNAEVKKYLDTLMQEMDLSVSRSRRVMFIEGGTILTLIVSALTVGGVIAGAAYLLWFLTLMYNHMWVRPKVERVFGELDGVFNTLEILGMLDRGHKRRKRIEIRSPFKRFKEFFERVQSNDAKEAQA